jgi:sialic acid synthase SpsE
MLALAERYKLPVGYSDHTEGHIAAVQAVTMGACVLEKHFTLRHDDAGPDHWFSVTPHELREYVNAVRDAEQRLGSAEIAPAEGELKIAAEQRLSAVAAVPLLAGAMLSVEAVTFKKPGTGIHPAEIEAYFGRRLGRSVDVNEVLVPEMFV